MKLLKIARTPAVTIGTECTIGKAVATMVDHGAGTVVVVEHQSAKGIFTAGNLLKRVVAKGKRLDETLLRQVMTSPPIIAACDMHPCEALAMIASNHIRHLPIVDSEEHVVECCRRDIYRRSSTRSRLLLRRWHRWVIAIRMSMYITW